MFKLFFYFILLESEVSELISFFNAKFPLSRSFFSVQVLITKSIFMIVFPFPKSFHGAINFFKIFIKYSSFIHQVILITKLNYQFCVTSHESFNLFVAIDKLVILFILVIEHLNLKDESLQNNFMHLLFDSN